MFNLMLIMIAALPIVARSDYTKPIVSQITLRYDKDGTLYFYCDADSGNNSYTLTMTDDSGNLHKIMKFQSSDHVHDADLEISLAINETGTYVCTAHNKYGMSNASIRLTDDLNIFNDENRQLQLSFHVFYAKTSTPPFHWAFLYGIKRGTPKVVKCFHDNKPLQLDNHLFMYTFIRPVAGTYKCVDYGQAYGFRVQLDDE